MCKCDDPFSRNNERTKMKFNDYGIYENNLSAKLLINNMINKANRYKYNFSLNQIDN